MSWLTSVIGFIVGGICVTVFGLLRRRWRQAQVAAAEETAARVLEEAKKEAAMVRKEAQRRFTVADLEAQTRGVECRKDAGVLDELPSAYKDIDAVMASQADLVEVIHTLKQVVCVKG